MNERGPEVFILADVSLRAAQGVGRLLRAAAMPRFAPRSSREKKFVHWKYQRYMHDYLGPFRAVTRVSAACSTT